MGEKTKYYWGVDCGSSEIKVVACNAEGEVLTRRKTRTLFPLDVHVQKAFQPREHDELTPFDINRNINKPLHKIIATGYGRHQLKFADAKLTEIKAHFLGVQENIDPQATLTIIDIGGQDAKIIAIKEGRVDKFAMNRKCAAGTGSFLEEMSNRLEIPISKLNLVARMHSQKINLNSYCTVFAGQEVIRVLMNGEKVENIIQGIYESLASRVMEMTAVTSESIIFSGGVMNYHPVLFEVFEKRFTDKRLMVAPNAQFCGALGASRFGIAQELEVKQFKLSA